MARLRVTAAQQAGNESLMNAELTNPLTGEGRKVMGSMKKTYGEKKGKQVFYATANKYGKNWHK